MKQLALWPEQLVKAASERRQGDSEGRGGEGSSCDSELRCAVLTPNAVCRWIAQLCAFHPVKRHSESAAKILEKWVLVVQ
eukprot:3190466-Rhodomonas_salina.1